MVKMSPTLILALSLSSVVIFDCISGAPIEDGYDSVAGELPEAETNAVPEEVKEAPVDEAGYDGVTEELPKADANAVPEEIKEAPADRSKMEGRQATTPSPVKEWFENLSKNMSTNSQNTLNDLQKWFAGLSGNSDTNNPFANILGNGQNSPVMILGSYQALKVPVPQFSDIIKGMGNMAMAAQGVNKLFGKTK